MFYSEKKANRFNIISTLLCLILATFLAMISWLSANLSLKIGIILAAVVVMSYAVLTAKEGYFPSKTGTILTVMTVIAILWPTYFTIRFPGLPSLDGRKIVFIFAATAIAYFILKGFSIKDRTLSSAGVKITSFLVLGYTALRLMSAFLSQEFGFQIIAIFWEWIYYYSVFFFVLWFCNNNKTRDEFFNLLMCLGIFVSTLSAIEIAIGDNLFVKYLPVQEEMIAALSVSRFRYDFLRAQGPFEHPLMLAEFSAFIFAFSLSSIIFKKSSTPTPLKYLALASSLVCIVLSGSRTGLICAGIVLISLLALKSVAASKNDRSDFAAAGVRFRLLILVGIVIFALVPIATLLVEGRNSVESGSSLARLTMLRKGIGAVLDSPFWGYGLGESGYIAGIEGTNGVLTMDNYLLGIAIESGLPSLIIFLFIFICPIWIGIRRITQFHDSDKAFICACISSLLSALFVKSIMSIPYNMFFMFAMSAFLLGSSVLSPQDHIGRKNEYQ